MNATKPNIEEETLAAEREAEWKGFKVSDLREAFEALSDPDDRRGEINMWIPHQLFQIAAAAVEFFTATELKVVGGPQPLTGKILVHADGYRMGPAGDH